MKGRPWVTRLTNALIVVGNGYWGATAPTSGVAALLGASAGFTAGLWLFAELRRRA